MPFHTKRLNDGNEIPQIAFGTGSVMKSKDVTDIVERALDNGFWHVDTSAVYNNEECVGTAIRESGLSREELYITTKYDGGDIREAIEKSLKKLGVSYVDLYLIHAPFVLEENMAAAWAKFEKIKADGLAKSIGVSNFGTKHLTELLKTAKILPAVNQVEFHPYNYVENIPLLQFSARFGIVIEAYSSLTPITKMPGGPVDKPIQLAADRLKATPAQVLLSWARSKGVVIVTTTSKSSRLKEYLDVADLPPLSMQEIADIEAAGAEGPTMLSMRVLTREVIPLAVLALLTFGLHWFILPMRFGWPMPFVYAVECECFSS